MVSSRDSGRSWRFVASDKPTSHGSDLIRPQTLALGVIVLVLALLVSACTSTGGVSNRAAQTPTPDAPYFDPERYPITSAVSTARRAISDAGGDACSVSIGALMGAVELVPHGLDPEPSLGSLPSSLASALRSWGFRMSDLERRRSLGTTALWLMSGDPLPHVPNTAPPNATGAVMYAQLTLYHVRVRAEEMPTWVISSHRYVYFF